MSMELTIPLNFYGRTLLLKLAVYEAEASLRRATRGLFGATTDTIAYTNTYTIEEDKDVVARVYFVARPAVEVVAHEATHVALGMLARIGETSLQVTAGDAPDLEEKLAGLVGQLTTMMLEGLEAPQSGASHD